MKAQAPDRVGNLVTYKNGNYQVFLDLTDGSKMRVSMDDYFDAEYPESMDVKITNMCDKGCPWCHEDSRPYGDHADLDQGFLDTIRPYTEIAVGGGNVLCHPHLEDFLLHLRELHCVPSITVNQDHFLHDFDYVKCLYERGLVYGVGVSLTEPTDELVEKASQLPTAVIHTINGILTEDDIDKLSGNDLKILVLGYKKIRRGDTYGKSHSDPISKNMEWLSANLDKLFGGFAVVSFDNLALEQLPIRDYIGEEKWSEFYMGDDGDHTFYIDMVKKEYAVSSTSTERFPIGDKSARDMFQHVKYLDR